MMAEMYGLDTGLVAWRERPLGATSYVLLGARYALVREAGQIVDCSVLVSAVAHLPAAAPVHASCPWRARRKPRSRTSRTRRQT